MRVSFSLLMIFLLLSGGSIGQRILSQYDFNKGGYAICLLEGPMGADRGIRGCPVTDQNAIDTVSFFYTSDTAVLNLLKKELLLYNTQAKNGTSSFYLCGYPFWFCVFKEGKSILKLPANIECGYMDTSMGQLLFRSQTLKQFRKSFKPLTVRYTCFKNGEEKAQFIERIKKDASYVSVKALEELSGDPTLYPVETVQLK
jgi:hypothetical protein